MDLFDERILAELNDGKPRVFAQLLGEVGFSRNTLKLHLKRLTAQSLVVKEKNGFKWTWKAEIRLIDHNIFLPS
jgi:DNA-binding HxlR family transcriptional regulator